MSREVSIDIGGCSTRLTYDRHDMGAYRFVGRDGVELACRETGDRPTADPAARLHGGGIVLLLEQQGRRARRARVSRRASGLARPRRERKAHERASYPPDVLADDGSALVEHLGLGDGDYDLGGYSLGARVVVRMLARGAKPRRAIVAGQGLAKVSGPQGGGTTCRLLTALVDGVGIEPDLSDARMADWISKHGDDPRALLYVSESFVPTPEDALRKITIPTLVAIGDQDERADADELAARMPNARFIRVPGDHESAFAAPELVAAIAAFLAER